MNTYSVSLESYQPHESTWENIFTLTKVPICAGSDCHTNVMKIKGAYKPFLPEEMYQKDQTVPTFLQVPEE